MKNKTIQIILSLVLVVFLLLLTDPFMLWMPPVAVMATLLSVTVLLCVWAGFVIYEKAVDEREALHQGNSGRMAYLAGLVVLTGGLLVQGFSHHIDPWIGGALAAMIAGKLAARIYDGTFR